MHMPDPRAIVSEPTSLTGLTGPITGKWWSILSAPPIKHCSFDKKHPILSECYCSSTETRHQIMHWKIK